MNRNLNILIIDDDTGMTESLADVLELKGYRVETANSGVEGVKKLGDQPFDCILLDIKMPDMNGLEVFRETKKMKVQTPVVMMTAYVLPGLIDQAQREGVLTVLRKPLDIDNLLGLLEKFKEAAAVLIVDDDLEFGESLQDGLLANGYKVDIIPEALNAIGMVCQTNYDYVFLDTKLDGGNGSDLITVLKRVAPETRVVLMTVCQEGAQESIDEELRRRAYACLTKPFEMGSVLDLLNEARNKELEESIDGVISR